MYSQKWSCYSQNRIIMFCLPVTTLIYLWEIYIFPGSVCLFCCRKYVDWSWEYINHSQTHECENWDWGRAIPRIGIHKWFFRCSVCCILSHINTDWTLPPNIPSSTVQLPSASISFHPYTSKFKSFMGNSPPPCCLPAVRRGILLWWTVWKYTESARLPLR